MEFVSAYIVLCTIKCAAHETEQRTLTAAYFLFSQVNLLQLVKNDIIENLDICSLHSGRSRLNNAGALELPERIDDNGSCDAYPVGYLARDKNTLIAVELLEDMLDSLELRK